MKIRYVSFEAEMARVVDGAGMAAVRERLLADSQLEFAVFEGSDGRFLFLGSSLDHLLLCDAAVAGGDVNREEFRAAGFIDRLPPGLAHPVRVCSVEWGAPFANLLPVAGLCRMEGMVAAACRGIGIL
jgi:hypothetical protein